MYKIPDVHLFFSFAFLCMFILYTSILVHAYVAKPTPFQVQVYTRWCKQIMQQRTITSRVTYNALRMYTGTFPLHGDRTYKTAFTGVCLIYHILFVFILLLGNYMSCKNV